MAAQSAASLQAKYAELRPQLAANQFQKPLHLDSSESDSHVAGNAYAIIDHPFAAAAAALTSPGNWCEVLILHINTKYCRPYPGGPGSVLNVSMGTKGEQPLDEAYRVLLAWRVAAQGPDYLQVSMDAAEGPLSSRDYRIAFEAVPVEGGRTFIRLSYAYAFGTAGRLAMQLYLGTAGRDKVGFTIAGKQADGLPRHIGGTRGAVERNTMRYFLAIEAFLGALSVPPPAQFEKRLRDWFAASERYPRQLREMGQREYLDMKRKEHLRQQAGLTGRLLQFSLLFQPFTFKLDELLPDMGLVDEDVLQHGLGGLLVDHRVGQLRLDGGLARVQAADHFLQPPDARFEALPRRG